MADRNKLRSVTLGAPAVRLSAQVKWNGEMFEVRRPSLKMQRHIEALSTDKKGRKDNLTALMQALIRCIYVPGTDELVFEAGDLAAMEDRGTEDFLGTFATALGNLSEETTPEVVEKNSGGAPIAAT